MRFLTTIFWLLLVRTVCGQVIVSDSYNVTASGTGFSLNTGVNTGINPPTTRLTGTAAANLRYMQTSTKTNSFFTIAGQKLQVAYTDNPGRVVLSADGTTPFNFASALGTTAATSTNPVVYDLAVRMANNTPNTFRCSFALGTAEGDATTWDFGVQLFRTSVNDSFYTVQKRVDSKASGLAADINTFITNTIPGTYGTEVSILMRVTDAGSETTYNSRVQVSLDGGFTWIYDTDSDSDLPNGWRLNGTGRYVMFDIAPLSGPVTFDDFSLRLVPVSATLLAPADGAQNVGVAPALTTYLTNTAAGNVSVTYFARQAPKPGPGPDFMIAIMPDTQNYARESSSLGDATKEMWFSQTEYIITNRVASNIVYAVELGDCVNDGDIFNGGPDLTQWRNATNAMWRLESPARTLMREGIPYGVVVGNHDQEPNGDPDGTTTYYNQYFGTSHFIDKSYYGGHYSTNNDSWFDFFSGGGMDFIVLSFEYDRYGSGIMDWAMSVLATNQTKRVIVAIHNAGSDATPVTFSAQGQTIYDTLKVNTNFFLMLAGHRFGNDGEGSRSDTFNGRTVRTYVSDYQGRTNGGNGLLRFMRFSPSNNLVSITTYSPWTGKYESDSDSQMSFSYNMQPNGAGSPGTPWAAVGTNLNVGSGTNSFVASGLQASKTYEWYAKITDSAGTSITTPTRLFTTAANVGPIASNMTVTVAGDQPSQIQLAGTDSNGDSITYQLNASPGHAFVTSFSTTTGLLTYQPVHGFQGTDRFSYHVSDSVLNSALANVDVTVTAPTDANTNGLPDYWETKFGVTNPAGDDDGDGLSNLGEYLANTNPTNAASGLKIVSATYDGSGQFVLQWQSSGNTRYRIQYSDDGMVTFKDIVRPIAAETDGGADGNLGTMTFTDSVSASTGTRYYRIKISP
ncbi:MAG: phosphohydrolase [Verrucomicrobiales bacterium]|nr:phosphohydrolase [Verrucomicrobiales bacterium]